ncbi:aminotransferase-like domain-containing protein [Sphingomonas sp. STIS6.2]|uniref:aminotransferase-like domain-containing protein n=1 Tax=Sphingomonas sp. STIS6.2 TaxID=1379700 RepID=UPI0004DB788B|nr:PLP-dependent aminotransferase family protein [Sphingomonas sp. STIS6.2]
MSDFKTIAQEIADDIALGRLQPGDRLPPQRIFAFNRGIAASTASRVYGELVRRGLITGETGRGTFVRHASSSDSPPLAQPPTTRINLETTYPVLDGQQALLSGALAQFASSEDALHRVLRETSVRPSIVIRDSIAQSLSGDGWRLASNSLLFAGNGRQAIAATFSAVAMVGERIGFDALTYPVAKTIAAKLGLVAVPLAMDEQGVRPDAIERAHRTAPLRAIFIQTTAHNPLGLTMPAPRRVELAVLVERLTGPVIIEDVIYAFVDGTAPPPLAAIAPNHTILIDSLSKRIAPGMTLGMIVAPPDYVERISASIVAGAWSAGGFALELGARWLADGTVAALVQKKRQDAAQRQIVARRALKGLSIRAHPSSYFLLLELPQRMRAATLVEAAAARGIAIAPASAFAVAGAHAPNAVRIGLANISLRNLDAALTTIAEILAKG